VKGRGEKEMGSGSLGQDLQTQIPWWFRSTGPIDSKQSVGSKTMVEMAKGNTKPLGETLET